MRDDLEGSRVHIDSVKLMAEATGIPDLSIEAAATISEDITSRLRQIITKAQRFMSHSNRTKLTCGDINKSLKWSDSQPVFGYESNPNERVRYSYVPEAAVFKYEDITVDLVQQFRGKPACESMQPDSVLEVAEPNLVLEKFDLTSAS